MGKLVVNKSLVTEEKAEALVKLCPFNAITYKDGVIDITSALKTKIFKHIKGRIS